MAKPETKKQAIELYEGAKARAKNMAASMSDQADKITGFAVAVGSAAGMGYYMAKSTDSDGQWWGMDKEIWVTGFAAAIAFWLGGKKDKASTVTANLALSVATGVGSAYAYGVAYKKGQG
jgi:hypothetical protein